MSNDSLQEVIATLRQVLRLAPQTPLAANTRLLGGVPEFDSLAVASVVIALEERFGLTFDDDDIDADLFETVGTLAAFVDRAVAPQTGGGSRPHPFFLAAGSGQLYCIRRDGPAGSRCVVFVPPFAEEMNRVRPIVTAAIAALNDAGLSCCFFDPHGTGDSDGDFADARWSLWLNDLHEIVGDVRARGAGAVDLVGIRLGARLAIDYAARYPTAIGRIVLWDPVLDGAAFLDRFLRIRTMAAMISGASESVANLRQRLARGETLEVAGYAVHPELANELDALDVAERKVDAQICWLSRGRDEALEAYARSMGIVATVTPAGEYEPYWASAETTTAPGLVESTRDFLAANA